MQREQILAQVTGGHSRFDVVVVGGGVTGAGIAREASGSGLRTLLVEQRDFAWGTSGRSSKMIHGGLRYLGSGHPALTRAALRERNRLLREAPGLVQQLPFLLPHRKGVFPGPRAFRLLLWLYDHMAGTHSRRRLAPHELPLWVPGLQQKDLLGGSLFLDAVTDDARLVMRLLHEAGRDGALCLNYVRALSVLRESGRVCGLRLQDEAGQRTFEVETPLVINATGAWVTDLQQQENAISPMRIRPLRGSHLVLPWSRLPVSCAVSFLHPVDHRPVFVFPWAGTTVLGTTDCDHSQPLTQEPAISCAEVQYLLTIADELFPDARISPRDVISAWAGVRPVVSDGRSRSPSRESREHVLQHDSGLVSIAGGKLTTFRPMARQALALGLGPEADSRLRPEPDAGVPQACCWCTACGPVLVRLASPAGILWRTGR